MCGPDSLFTVTEESTPAEKRQAIRDNIKRQKRVLSIHKANAKSSAKEWNRTIKDDEKRIAELKRDLSLV